MKYCSNCGQPLREGVKVCTNCGAPVKSNKDQKSNHDNQKNKRNMYIQIIHKK